jgi:hydroxyacylglutathione hydrolase
MRGAICVTRLSHPPYGANTYILAKPGHKGCLVIDPGEQDGEHTVGALADIAGQLEFVLLTHEHFDHICGLSALRRRWPCHVVCSRECSAAITDPKRNFSRYLVHRDVAFEAGDLCCEDLGWELDWSGVQFQFIPTPGHSPGSICIAVGDLLFTGDTLLPDSKGVTKLPGASKQALASSLAFLFASFGPETMVYPGHGEPFSLKQARLCNAAEASDDLRPAAGRGLILPCNTH